MNKEHTTKNYKRRNKMQDKFSIYLFKCHDDIHENYIKVGMEKASLSVKDRLNYWKNEYIKNGGLEENFEIIKTFSDVSMKDHEIHTRLKELGYKNLKHNDQLSQEFYNLTDEKEIEDIIKFSNNIITLQQDKNPNIADRFNLRFRQKETFEQYRDYNGHYYGLFAEPRFGKTRVSVVDIESDFQKFPDKNISFYLSGLLDTNIAIVDEYKELINKCSFKLVLAKRPESNTWKLYQTEKLGYKDAGIIIYDKDMKFEDDQKYLFVTSIQDISATKFSEESDYNFKFFDKYNNVDFKKLATIVFDEAHQFLLAPKTQLFLENNKPEKLVMCTGTPYVLTTVSEKYKFNVDNSFYYCNIDQKEDVKSGLIPATDYIDLVYLLKENKDFNKYQDENGDINFQYLFDNNFDLIKQEVDNIIIPALKTSVLYGSPKLDGVRNAIIVPPFMVKYADMLYDYITALKKKYDTNNILNVINLTDNPTDANGTKQSKEVVIKQFNNLCKKEDTINILISITQGLQSITYPDLHAVIFMDNSSSAQKYVQAAYRGKNQNKEKSKERAFCIDYNTNRVLKVIDTQISVNFDRKGKKNYTKQDYDFVLNEYFTLMNNNFEVVPYTFESIQSVLIGKINPDKPINSFDIDYIINQITDAEIDGIMEDIEKSKSLSAEEKQAMVLGIDKTSLPQKTGEKLSDWEKRNKDFQEELRKKQEVNIQAHSELEEKINSQENSLELNSNKHSKDSKREKIKEYINSFFIRLRRVMLYLPENKIVELKDLYDAYDEEDDNLNKIYKSVFDEFIQPPYNTIKNVIYTKILSKIQPMSFESIVKKYNDLQKDGKTHMWNTDYAAPYKSDMTKETAEIVFGNNDFSGKTVVAYCGSEGLVQYLFNKGVKKVIYIDKIFSNSKLVKKLFKDKNIVVKNITNTNRTFEETLKEELNKMIKLENIDYIIGNPPYQNESGQPMYPAFILNAFKLGIPNQAYIFPSRWMSNKAKNQDSTYTEFINSFYTNIDDVTYIRLVDDEKILKSIFPSSDTGNLIIFSYNKGNKSGLDFVTNNNESKHFKSGKEWMNKYVIENLDENGNIDSKLPYIYMKMYNHTESILEKINSKKLENLSKYTFNHGMYGLMNKEVLAQKQKKSRGKKETGYNIDYKSTKDLKFSTKFWIPKNGELRNGEKNNGFVFIDPNGKNDFGKVALVVNKDNKWLKDEYKTEESLEIWKKLPDNQKPDLYDYSSNYFRLTSSTLNHYASGSTLDSQFRSFIIEPSDVVGGNIIFFKKEWNRDQLENLRLFLKTRFATYLFLLTNPTQHMTSHHYIKTPVLDFTKKWTMQDIKEYFGFTDDEYKEIFEKTEHLYTKLYNNNKQRYDSQEQKLREVKESMEANNELKEEVLEQLKNTIVKPEDIEDNNEEETEIEE
jgi:hypothetical protein